MKIYNALTSTYEPLLPITAPNIHLHVCRDQTPVSRSHVHDMIDDIKTSMIERYLTYKEFKITRTQSDLTSRIDIHYGSHPEGDAGTATPLCRLHSNPDIAKYWLHRGTSLINHPSLSEAHTHNQAANTAYGRFGKELTTWLVLRHHYRSTVHLTDQLGRDNLNILRNFYLKIEAASLDRTIEKPNLSEPKVAQLVRNFESAMNNDFNTPEALTVLIRSLSTTSSSRGNIKPSVVRQIGETIVYLGRLMGLFESQDLVRVSNELLIFQQHALNSPEILNIDTIEQLIENRSTARRKKRFNEADHIHNILSLHGVVVVDGPSDNTWKFITG